MLYQLFEYIKMGLVFLGILLSGMAIYVAIRDKVFSDEVVYPWVKEEEKQAKKAAKEKARQERKEARYWREVEKKYR